VDRQSNVQNIFVIKQGARHRVDAPGNFVLSGKTVILVDDVVTTGATLSEASAVLKLYGAKRVVALTIAYSIPERTKGSLQQVDRTASVHAGSDGPSDLADQASVRPRTG